MARLQQQYRIDTIVPVRTNMDVYADVIGLTRSPDFGWEPYVSPLAAAGPPSTPSKPLRLQKREASQTAPAGVPRTLLGIERGLRSWTDCSIPLTAIVSREVDAQGESKDGVIVTTSPSLTDPQIRSTYELRTAIEERHRQYKCFWDLTHMHSRALSLVINQALFVLLAYTLLQAHLRLRQRQSLNRRTPTSIFPLLTPHAPRGRRLLPAAILFIFAGGVRPDFAHPRRSGSGPTAGENPTHREKSLLSIGKRPVTMSALIGLRLPGG